MPYHSPISNRSPKPNNKQLLSLLGLFIALSLTLIISLFFLINQVVNWIPISLEKELGKIIFNELFITKKESTIQDKLNILLNNLEAKLPENSREKRDYQVVYLEEETVNALAIPGDIIIIYEGLLKTVDSENELVMILGHEIGHFAHRDHLRRFSNFLLIKLLFSFIFEPTSIAHSGADLSNTIVNAQYSQKQEIEADKFGLHLLNEYYNHVAGATDFFTKLQAENNTHKNIAFLSSHPLPQKRIKKLKKLIETQGYTFGKKVDLDLFN